MWNHSYEFVPAPSDRERHLALCEKQGPRALPVGSNPPGDSAIPAPARPGSDAALTPTAPRREGTSGLVALRTPAPKEGEGVGPGRRGCGRPLEWQGEGLM